MVYNGNSYENGCYGGTPILGHPHMIHAGIQQSVKPIARIARAEDFAVDDGSWAALDEIANSLGIIVFFFFLIGKSSFNDGRTIQVSEWVSL